MSHIAHLLRVAFGAKAQVVVGVLFLAATAFQWSYWTWITRPTVNAVFQVSMEALAFASYAVIATGLGYRATERVETAVVENVESANTVSIHQ